jgi:hypothetical protein
VTILISLGSKMKRLAVLLLVLGFVASNANATLISISDQADITETGQDFLFEFDNLADSIGAGVLTFGGSGDFDHLPSGENVTVSLGIFGSFFMNSSTGLISNNVVGLDLTGFTNTIILAEHDETFEAVFSVSNSLMLNLVSTGNLNVLIQNGNGVSDWFDVGVAGTDEDYISFNLSYNTQAPPAPLPVSEPSILIIMLLSTGILLSTRRR